MCIKKIPENIHAYVVPWAHDTIIYNSHYLESHEAGKTRTSPTKPLTLSVQTRHHHAHVIEHESKHLDQARHW